MKKKLLSLLLAVIMLFGITNLTACNSEKEIELTLENIRDYLSIECVVKDFEIKEDTRYLYGIPITDYSGSYGEAELIINKKSENMTFQNVEISLRLYVSANNPHPWEFKSGNKNEKDEKYDMYYNCKYLDCTIPYDGKYSYDLNFVIGNNENSQSVLDTTDLRYVSVEIISVCGSVIEK